MHNNEDVRARAHRVVRARLNRSSVCLGLRCGADRSLSDECDLSLNWLLSCRRYPV